MLDFPEDFNLFILSASTAALNLLSISEALIFNILALTGFFSFAICERIFESCPCKFPIELSEFPPPVDVFDDEDEEAYFSRAFDAEDEEEEELSDDEDLDEEGLEDDDLLDDDLLDDDADLDEEEEEEDDLLLDDEDDFGDEDEE